MEYFEHKLGNPAKNFKYKPDVAHSHNVMGDKDIVKRYQRLPPLFACFCHQLKLSDDVKYIIIATVDVKSICISKPPEFSFNNDYTFLCVKMQVTYS